MLVRKAHERPRLITRDGYTIVYEEGNKSVIYHPNGGISHPPHTYINENGRGMNHSNLYQVATLKRLTDEGQVITRRDDQTVII